MTTRRMTPDRWHELKTIFAEARALDDAEREAYLAETCPDDALRDEVEALLAADDRPTGPLDALMSAVRAPLRTRERRPSAPASTPPSSMGPYEIVGTLGHGGMAHVYKAHDPRLDRFVALKVLSPHLHIDPTARERFLQEARAASALDHPNVCTIYDVGTTGDGTPYIAMACYDQPTVADRIQDGPLPLETALDVAIQTSDGLAGAHAAGIVHRDVKPSNLIVTKRGTVKILDFGIAKLVRGADLTETSMRLGTVAYMAPEQVEGEPVDARTDLWALGVVLYEMITGQRPFTGETHAALIYAVLERDPPPPSVLRPDVPDALDAVLRRALAKAPDHRFSDAPSMAEALRAIRRGEPPPAPSPPEPSSLPAVLTSFVGREDEIERVEALFDRARLVTLTGPAGTGKTRLSLYVASRLEDSFDDGVTFVSLAPVTDPGLVASEIVQALGTEPPGATAPLDHLKGTLRNQNRLLVLDNFEQVVAAAPAVSELLAAAPGVCVLVTSRMPLHVSGEHEAPVPPLDVPDPSEAVNVDVVQAAPAVALFVERAQAVDPNFTLTSTNAPVVADLCRRLDGLPLAIELAAARINLFSPEALRNRLEQQLDLLTGGPRDHPERHQTLRQAIAWSYDLLDDPVQQFFRRLAVFVGGWTLEGAAAVTGTDDGSALDAVAELVDHSLLRRERGPDGEPRFSMLETIRVYALEKLHDAGEADAVHRTHARYVLDRAEEAATELTGGEQAAWLDRLDAEHGNLRAAQRWMLDRGEHEWALRLGAALWRFWLVRGHLLEGRQWLETVLAATDPSLAPEIRARVLNAVSTFAHNQGDLREARAFLQEALDLWRVLDDTQGLATGLNNLAWVDCEISALNDAEARADEARVLCRRLDDLRGEAVALNNLGWVAHYRGAFATASRRHRESLALRRTLDDRRGIAYARINAAWAETYLGHYDRAHALLDDAQADVRTVGDVQEHIWWLTVNGLLAWHRGQLDRAAEPLREGLEHWTVNHNSSLRALVLGALTSVRIDQERVEEAASLLDEAEAQWDDVGTPWGRAVAHHERARLAIATDDPTSATEHITTSWSLRHEVGDRHGMAECLETLTALTFMRGNPESATRVLAAAQALRDALPAPCPHVTHQAIERRRTRLQRTLGSTTFERLWGDGLALSPDAAAALFFD